LGRTDGGHIAAGAGADDGNVVFHFIDAGYWILAFGRRKGNLLSGDKRLEKHH
jgi:hypothetical protein